MKKIAIFGSPFPSEFTGEITSPLPDKLPPPASLAPVAPALATGSVVTKVAGLLVQRGHKPDRKLPGQWEEGFTQQKILMSLQGKTPL